jgi:6-phosphogluconolactonase
MAVRVLIGSYGDVDEDTIHVAEFDSSTLRLVGSVAGIVNPSFLVTAPGRGSVYSVSETAVDQDGIGGHVHQLRMQTVGGRTNLAVGTHQSSGGDLPCHLAVDRTERWLAVSNYGSGSVAVLPIGHDGALGEIAALAQHSGNGPVVDRQRGPHAHSTVFTPDGGFLLAADLGADAIVVYEFDVATGSIHERRVVSSRPGSGPRHLAFDPSGTHLFVVEELANRVTVYRWDGDAVDLQHLDAVSSRAAPAGDNLAADLKILLSGGHAYVSNRGDDSVSVIGFDGIGRLDRVSTHSSGGSWPRGLALTPDGTHLLVANQMSDDVVLLPLTESGSSVGDPVCRVSLRRPSCVAFWSR